MFPEFTLALLKESKNNLHTCIETCGYADEETIRSIAPYADIFLWDIKETDPKLHKEYTGVSNGIILKNLEVLNDLNKEIVLRCPVIPGYNDRTEHFVNIGRIAEKYPSVIGVDVEPYHSMGVLKSENIGCKYALEEVNPPEKDVICQWIDAISENTTKTVNKA